MSYFIAAKFIKNVVKPSSSKVQVEHRVLTLESGQNISADVYQPKNPNRRCRGTILLFHGMNQRGNQDPRVLTFCRAAALCNYRAIAPHYEIITHHLIDQQTIEEFASTIRVVAQDKSLCKKGKVGLFTASFSGSFSLRAATRKNVRDYISSFCCIGICYNPITTFNNILAEANDDYYAKMISIKNFLRIMGELTPELEQGMEAMIGDVFYADQIERFKKYMSTLSLKDQKVLQNIYDAITSQHDLSAQYQEQIYRLNELFIPDSHTQNLNCSVTLIHSNNDKVINKAESELLYTDLRQKKIPTRLLITPLLDHTNLHFSLKAFKQAIRLLQTFGWFLKQV